jgi:isoamylase
MLAPRQLPLVLLLLVSVCVVSCAKDDYVQLYRTHDRAPNLTAEAIENLEHMGPTLVDEPKTKGVNFAVYSENATRLELLLFDDPESNRPTRQFEMKRFGDVWNLFVEGVGLGQHYGYIAWGPNWVYDPKWIPGRVDGFLADVDEHGNRFNPNKLLMDPWAKAVHRDHDWSKGSLATGPRREEVTYAAAAKSVVVRSTYVWGEQEEAWRQKRRSGNHPGHDWKDLIIYEVHAKGFTMDRASGVAHPGTYRGVGEMADYLKDLGITAVELMPIHEKPLDGGYWGYQTLNFFAPEITYAWTKRPNEIIDEFKWMVEELHKRDIEVIIDVVYNHTGEGGLWRSKIEKEPSPDSRLDSILTNYDPKEITGLYSYRGLDNQAWYALPPDDRGQYWNNTGVGNQTRPNHRPMRRLIMDSLRFYVEELHVDGFRFDLAPVLGETEQNGGYYWIAESVKDTVLQDIVDDPVLRRYNTRVIAEPWSLADYPIGGFPAASDGSGVAWYEWNGRFRDFWKTFLNCDAWELNSSSRHGGDLTWDCNKEVANRDEGIDDGGAMLTGSAFLFQWNGRRPYHAVNFITVHDGFTLYDSFTYEHKLNMCGPLNPICCDNPNSAWCDTNSGEDHNRSRDWGSEPMKRQMMRNAFAILLFSHGTPLILGGDEWMRTQLGNNNAYSTQADNADNWFQWGIWKPNPDRNRMHDFVRQMIAFRKRHSHHFAPDAFGGTGFAWKSAQNTDQVNWNGRHVMIHYHDRSAGPEVAVLLNMEAGPVTFTLPQGRAWQRMIDTQSYFDTDEYFNHPDFAGQKPVKRSWNATLDTPVPLPEGTYTVPARSVVLLEDASP